MQKKDIKIRSSDGGEFDCFVAIPKAERPVPAIVLASAIHGVDPDLRGIAEDFASRGFIAAAPDLFWRTETPGPITRDDPRSAPRGQPRLARIKAGERDIADVLPVLRKEPLFNGRAAVIGFCYGGPFSVLGPKRLGYDAGISCHGTQMLDFIHEFEGLTKPVCLIWGDKDHAAPPNVLHAYRKLSERMKNVELHVFPGIEHGYMMKAAKIYSQNTYDFSMGRAVAILEGLRNVGMGAN